MAKTVFFVNFHFLASRNLLTSDVRSYLENNPELRVIMFVPDFKTDFFKKEYRDTGFNIIGLNEKAIKAPPIHIFFRWLCYHLIPTKAMYNRLGYVHYENPSFRNWIELVVNQFFRFTFAQITPLKKIIQKLDLWITHYDLIAKEFDKFKPDYCFSTDLFHEVDTAFSITAKRRGIPVVGMVRSWDNPTTKTLLRGYFDKIIVNNNFIKDEMVRYHYCAKDNIFVGGTPQFDMSFKQFKSDKTAFYNRLGIPLNKKIIFFAGSGYLLSQSDLEFCEILKDSFKNGQISQDFIVLVRAHPASTEFLQQFEPDENFVLDCPGHEFKQKMRAPEFTVNDQMHLLESIKYSSVLIYVHTTLAIDALPFDIPQIILCFDGKKKKAKWHHPMLYHNEDHFKRFLDTDASKKVYSVQELTACISNYIKNPKIDHEKRLLAAKEQIFSIDGNSGHVIGQYLLNFFGVKKYDRNNAGETHTSVQ